MAEGPRMEEEQEKKKFVVPDLCLQTVKNTRRVITSTPSSPVAASKTPKPNCLCSPTTHVGSFRCRYHRTSGLNRNSMSVGSKLSELAQKPAAVGTLRAQYSSGVQLS
ncbi:hypothetical protein M9H77_04208 [Catharanthus roseus]|uniref:Uncharacterized protein n=1 Tax=Catharanthus roseus TaxID=4058 RepID=A0ACC0CDL7_CATRO|nr:hypothetical protein M9H77_04208 [Catharanthus roseus]